MSLLAAFRERLWRDDLNTHKNIQRAVSLVDDKQNSSENSSKLNSLSSTRPDLSEFTVLRQPELIHYHLIW
jgi:hypothetical protein